MRSSLAFVFALVVGALTGPLAAASEYAVELSPQGSKTAAEAQLSQSSTEGAHVVRRYVQHAGWSYVVVVDGLPSLEAARLAAGHMATTENPATIFEKDGKEIKQLEVVTAPAAAAVAEDEASAHTRRKRGADDGADEVLDAAVRAHGGRGAGLERLAEATGVRFVFDRTVPADGGQLVAHNAYVRQGTSARLDVDITSGDGQSSVTVVRPDGKAWVVVGGARTDREAARVREVLERFSPEAVLAVPLGLSDDVETAEVWRNLRLVGTQVEDGGNRQILEPTTAANGGLVSAAFDPIEHTLRRVTWSADSGQLTFRYDDYRRLDRHLIVPFHARVERDGALVEDVRVLEFTLDPPADPSIFALPGDPG